MIENSIVAWLGFGCLVALASWTGLQVSRALLWKEAVYRVRIPLAFGLALAPFLAGFAVMVPMVVLRGASHGSHVAVACGLLIVAGVFAKALARPQGKLLCLSEKGFGVYLLGGYLLLWLLMLGVNAVFLPLLQNDALEYATVGRILFESRDLLSYPAIRPETTSSGFYGPWTHPPLYVALIYLSYVIQGHANEPGLMRLIAPWFLATAVCALIALGRLASRQIGLISGILLISTPLLFLGADSALIDALPVSGMVLLLVALVGLQAQQPRYSLTVGAVVGVVLWTHSQAILFIPLMAAVLLFQNGLLRWRSALSSVSLATGATMLVGGGYYVRNYFLFGSPISDNPAVFALEKLDWNAYFSYARGLDHWVAKVQYGIFKGWFSFEAYGLLFWFGTAGFVFLLATTPFERLKSFILNGTEKQKDVTQLYTACGVVIASYFVAVVLSVAVGIDLMVRNERYLLIVTPILGIGGAYGISQIGSFCLRLIRSATSPAISRDVAFGGIFTACVFLLFQWFLFGFYYRWHYQILLLNNISNEEKLLISNGGWFNYILSKWPNICAVRVASTQSPGVSTILALRPADMFYADNKKKMLSYLDPSLNSFYKSNDLKSGIAALRDLGVRYVLLPDYFLPPVYNSQLMEILGNPCLSKLVYSNGTSQLYELSDSGLKAGETKVFDPGVIPWTRTTLLRLGGRKATAAIGLSAEPMLQAESTAYQPLFHRDYSTLLSTGKGKGLSFNRDDNLIEISCGEHLLSVDVEGEGYVSIWAQIFDDRGIPEQRNSISGKDPIRIGDFSLTPQRSRLNFKRRILISDKSKFIRLGIEHNGKSHMKINRVSLLKLAPDYTNSTSKNIKKPM